jgi:cytochrome P450
MFRFDPFSSEIDADPFPAYRRLRDEYPCFWSEEANAWILSRFADIVVALNDWRRYSSTKGNNVAELPNRAGGTLGTTDPPRHDQLRALIQYAFVKRNLDSLTGPIRDIAREAAEALRGRQRFDFVGDFCGDFTVRVLSCALGLPTGDQETLRRNAIMMAQTDPTVRAKGPQNVAAFEWMKAYAAEVIAERRAHPRDDLISHFARAEIDGDRLSERELLMTTTTLIMAGVESLCGFLSMFALNLADFPDVRHVVAANPSQLPDAMEESLRYNTSAQRFRRCLTQDVELHGQYMRAGDLVCLAYGSGNRDDRQYPNAEIYDLARKPRGHLGFGGSTHACLGATIARLATVIAMDEFHKVVPDYGRVDVNPPWMPSATFRSPLRLELETA